MARISTVDVMDMKGEKRIVMLTAYDYPTARLVDEGGVDIILVGDSSGVVVAGYENTLPVTLDETIYHTKAVVRGSKNALVVADMPFMSYQESLEQARRNAGKVMKETGCQAIKLEGGENMADTIRAIVDIDIPVMAHIGLTPQSIHRLGGYKVRGKTDAEAEQLMRDAVAVEEAGAFSVVLECVPEQVAKQITEKLSIPTIGIGAGRFCDGQVLVFHDMVGLFDRFRPRFVKQYANVWSI
ncbi:MAG TPA: 3-methyl-2-oxobutanoate hydroxymethyltransferase, partial [Proteobacteria bacterium]|nr:3-methyl-2-oxobutanoate hydroxymethyltransferase [Pseudomonadota bacterium]